MKARELIITRLQDSINTKLSIIENKELIEMIEQIAFEITKAINNGGKVILCGNGGSASDALHMAGEIVGRFQKERSAWPVVVLNADVATMTAIANDYGYDEVFARQVEGQMKAEDLFMGISTSGNSENIYRAVLEAQRIGGKTAGLLGKNGGKIGAIVDYPVIVPSSVTARIQESHITIIHIMCEILEELMEEY